MCKVSKYCTYFFSISNIHKRI